MAYAHYYLYPASTSSHSSSTSRQYSPNLYYHQHHHHQHYLNPVNNYYMPSYYRWPNSYLNSYNYNVQPYGYDYSNLNYNNSNASTNSSNNSSNNSYKIVDRNQKSVVRPSHHKKLKYNSNERAKSIKKHSIQHAIPPAENTKSDATSRHLAIAHHGNTNHNTTLNTTSNSVKPASTTIANPIDEQKNKDNLKMQLISQLTNQTQIELNKLLEMKNKRRQITYLGIVTANPSEYVKKYGKDLIEPVKDSPTNLPLEVFNSNNSDTELTESENLDDPLSSITVEPSTSNRTLNTHHNTNTNNNTSVINERTYKLAVDENGQYSLKAI